MTVTPLTHNTKNAITERLVRVEEGSERYISKLLGSTNRADTPMEWRASDQPNHWNYWRREANVYESNLSQLLAGSGVRLPALLGVQEDENQIELRLEDVQGKTGTSLSVDDCALICERWGVAQSRLQPLLRESWCSQNFIRTYGESKPADYSLLTDDEAWAQPLIAQNWPQELREGLVYLYHQREALWAVLRNAPQLASHLDFWPNNAFVTNAGEVVLIDWTFFGSAAACEDVGNFIPDAIFDGFFPSSMFAELESRLFTSYIEGLKTGVEFDLDQADTWLWASAVKYVWLGPLLLARASLPEQSAYGGLPLDDANEQYLHRGVTLLRLCEWAQKALA